MKSFVFIPALIVILTILSACKEEDKEIIYPKTGNFGDNLLQADSLAIIASSAWGGETTSYSLRAELPENASVKLVFSYQSAGSGSIEFNDLTKQGWSMDYVTSEEHSSVIHFYGYVGVCDMKVFFYYSGTAEIEIYENGDTIPSRIKTLAWQI